MELLLVSYDQESHIYIYKDIVKIAHKSDSECYEGCIQIECTMDL